jgi:hypothetical protein
VPILRIILPWMLYLKPVDLIRKIYSKQDENENHVRIFDADVGILPNPDYSQIFLIEPRTEYLRSFSVVPPCEAFASLFLHTLFEYRQKKPLKYSIPGCCANFMNMNNPG